MIDFIDEVKAELKRDRQLAAAKKYGPWFAGSVILIVITTALGSWYQSHLTTSARASSIQFFAAMASETTAPLSAADAFEAILTDRTKGYSELAGLQQANILANQGDYETAISAYHTIADNSSHDHAIRELALLQATTLMIDHLDISPETDQQIDANLARLSAKSEPWRYTAIELMAFRAMRQEDETRAATLFEALRDDPQTPAGIFRRANKILTLLTPSEVVE